MNINKLVVDGLKHSRIRELYLYQVPILKTVDDWGAVKEIGKVSFQGKHASYNGGLIEYKGKIYFVKDSTIVALTSFRKWNFKAKIEVVNEKDWKRKVTDFQAKYSKENQKTNKHAR